MKKIETLLIRFHKANNRVSKIAQEFEKTLVFKGFNDDSNKLEIYYDPYTISVCYGDIAMLAEEAVELMKKKGCICPEDF